MIGWTTKPPPTANQEQSHQQQKHEVNGANGGKPKQREGKATTTKSVPDQNRIFPP
jgi:hypothetical protein